MAALSAQQQQELALSAAYEDDTPTPLGWRRKLVPHIGKGLVPARTDVVFIAPSGEEFKTKAHLLRYLRSNKGSPSFSEFIWITDEIPRRSSRSLSKRSKSPPKSATKRKPTASSPLEELKATKHRHTGNREDVERHRGDEKKRHKEAHTESTGDIEVSPTWSSAKDGKKATKEKMIAKGGTQFREVSSKAQMSETNSDLQESEKHDDGKGQETTKERDKDGETTISGDEEPMEDTIVHENIKEEDKNTTNNAIEEEEAMELISQKTIKEGSSKTENILPKDSDSGHNDACIDDPDGSKDGTMSLLGSDFSTDGMETESDVFESGKNESPLA